MSDADGQGINNERYNLHDPLNLPTHGALPKWLEDMSEDVINNRSASGGSKTSKLYHVVDVNSLKDGSKIPSRISYSEPSTLEKQKSRSSANAQFGRRSSLTLQVLARNAPQYIMLNKENYLVPQLEGKIDFALLQKDIQQTDLEKSWKGLNAFRQNHKGRLDSAKNDIPSTNRIENWDSSLSPLASTSEYDSSSCYSPSFLDKQTPPLRSKSEMSNYVPYYVYTKIQKATEYDNPSPSSLHANTNELLNAPSISKAKSSEDIYSHFESESSFLQTNKRNSNSKSRLPCEDTTYLLDAPVKRETYFQESSIEKHLNEYKLKVDQENRLRERIINELLTENERITERLKHKNSKNKLDRRKLPKTPSFDDVPLHQKLYNKNSKYKSTPYLKQFTSRELDTNGSGYEQENLIEYYIEGTDSVFVIPELPTGKILKIDLLSTWGDRHYVGLNGIEIFGSNGKLVNVRKISASPADVNILPENTNDPRIVTNLLDGVNRTQDDVHLWLAPFDQHSQHVITIEFRNVTTLAMIRIWNYNKSRIHSFRGVRDIVMTLDGVSIFKGEIAKACGGIMGGVDAFGDTILFTTDDNILEIISQNDNSYSTLTTTTHPEAPFTTERPPTVATLADRPYTGAPSQLEEQTNTCVPKDQILLGARRMDIVLLSNWGYANIIGLTGIEVNGVSDNVVLLNEENVSCNSKIKTVNLKALVDGENVTTDIGNMWWVPYRPEQEVIVTMQFDDFTYISGLRIWNYNQSPETTYAGVRAIKVLLDKTPVVNQLTRDETFLLRRAPGNTHYDFVQDVHFADHSTAPTPENYVQTGLASSLYKSEMPEGFVFQFIIFSTWGDQYYCGLNGIELYDEFGERIILEEQNICAYPESINVLPGVYGDIRTPDKLIDGINNDDEGAHSWLAPIIPKCLNRIYIVLDQPVTVSLIKLWNYSKTSGRGIKEFGVLVDDLLVYNGVLDKYAKKKGTSAYRSILFTDDQNVLEKEYDTYIRHSIYSQEVVYLDENRMTTGGSLPNPDQTLRPFTSVSPFDRGYTSQ